MVPGDDERGEEADGSDEDGAAGDGGGPIKRVGDEAERLEAQPGAGQVDHGPLSYLAVSYAAKKLHHASVALVRSSFQGAVPT